MWPPPTCHHSLSVLLYPLFCLHPEPGCRLQSRKSADGKSQQLSQASTHLSRLGGALALIPDSASSTEKLRNTCCHCCFIIIEIGSLHVKSGQQCNTHSPYLLERVPMRAEGLKHTLSWLPGRGGHRAADAVPKVTVPRLYAPCREGNRLPAEHRHHRAGQKRMDFNTVKTPQMLPSPATMPEPQGYSHRLNFFIHTCDKYRNYLQESDMLL